MICNTRNQEFYSKHCNAKNWTRWEIIWLQVNPQWFLPPDIHAFRLCPLLQCELLMNRIQHQWWGHPSLPGLGYKKTLASLLSALSLPLGWMPLMEVSRHVIGSPEERLTWISMKVDLLRSPNCCVREHGSGSSQLNHEMTVVLRQHFECNPWARTT